MSLYRHQESRRCSGLGECVELDNLVDSRKSLAPASIRLGATPTSRNVRLHWISLTAALLIEWGGTRPEFAAPEGGIL